MKVQFEFHKKNVIIYGAVMAAALLLWVYVRYPVWVLIAFGAVFAALMCMELELPEKLPWLWTGLLTPLGALLTTYSIQYLLLDEELFAKTKLEKWELNFLCVLTVYLFVLACSARPRLSCIIADVTLLVFAFIDYFVYMFRQNEFTFADLRAIGTGLSVAAKYTFELTPQAVYVLMWAGLYITLAAKCRIAFEKKLPVRLLALAMCVLAALPVGLRIDAYNTETWEQKGTYRNGYVLNFLLQIRDSFITEPEGYDLNVIAALEEQYSRGEESSIDVTNGIGEESSSDAGNSTDIDSSSDDSRKDPVIIVIMNESFADLTTIGDFSTNLPIMPFIDSLKENTLRGYALSSVFGAKTPNSEWEYLTGNTMAFLPAGSVVYQQYLNKTPYSLLTDLKGAGYTCVAMHPYYSSGWSRDAVYPRLGYDETYFIDYFDQDEILREYITDRELYRRIIERYESRADGERLFLMGITMQNHGGYTETYDNFPEEYYKTDKSYTDANQFLSLVHESDEAVKELVTYFESVDQPVEIVFFGDHQPSLTSRFYKLLNGKGLSGLTLAELENLYKVPFFIWTNYETPAEELPLTSLNYLSTLTLERAGIALGPYNRFLADMMEAIPAVNSRGYYSSAYGIYRHLEDATGEEAQWLKKYEILQYNAMFDKKNRSDVFFPYWDE